MLHTLCYRNNTRQQKISYKFIGFLSNFQVEFSSFNPISSFKFLWKKTANCIYAAIVGGCVRKSQKIC